MQTVQLSDEAYQALLARRIGQESLSVTLINNLIPLDETIPEETGWDVEKLDADLNTIRRTEKYSSFDEYFIYSLFIQTLKIRLQTCERSACFVPW